MNTFTVELKDTTFDVLYVVDRNQVDYSIFERVGESADGKPVYEDFSEGPIDALDEESMTAFGSVKWDGCSNWQLSPDNCMTHFCHPDEIDDLAAVLRACYEKTAEVLPTWNKEVAE